MTRDLVFDADGKPYAKVRRTPAQQAEYVKKDGLYWAWVEAKMGGAFKGSLAEFKASQTPLADRKLKELMPMATALKIKGRWKMRRADLIVAIEAAGFVPMPGPLLQIMMET